MPHKLEWMLALALGVISLTTAKTRAEPPNVERPPEFETPPAYVAPSGWSDSSSEPDPFGAWARAGIGTNGKGLVGTLAVDARVEHHFFTAHYASVGYKSPSFSISWSDKPSAPDPYTNDLALLYGGSWWTSHGAVGAHGAIAVGPALAYGHTGDAKFQTPALSLEALCSARFATFGFGIDLLGDLNVKQSFFAALLTLEIGYFGRYMFPYDD